MLSENLEMHGYKIGDRCVFIIVSLAMAITTCAVCETLTICCYMCVYVRQLIAELKSEASNRDARITMHLYIQFFWVGCDIASNCNHKRLSPHTW